MTVPAFRLYSNVAVAPVAELPPVRVAGAATFNPMILLPHTFTHHLVPLAHKEPHVVMPHPGRIPDAFSLFMDDLGSCRRPATDTDGERVIDSGRGKGGQKNRHRQNAGLFKQSPLFQPVTGFRSLFGFDDGGWERIRPRRRKPLEYFINMVKSLPIPFIAPLQNSVTLGSIYACKIRWGSGLDGLDKIGAFEGYEGIEGIEGIETSEKLHLRPEFFSSPGSAGDPPAGGLSGLDALINRETRIRKLNVDDYVI